MCIRDRGIAVEDQRGQRRAAHLLGHGRIVEVAQPGAAISAVPGGIRAFVAGRKEEVPQPLGPGRGLELGDDRVRSPGVLPRGSTADEIRGDQRLGGTDPGVDELTHASGELGRPRTRGEVHGADSSPCLLYTSRCV